MVLIAPSLMAANLLKIGEEVAAVEAAGADWLHVDVMDGRFAPNLTFGSDIVRQIKAVSGLFLDVHLMVESPERFIDEFAKAGADHISVHAENARHLHRDLSLIRERGRKAGLVINPGTAVAVIEPVIDLIDTVSVMGVNPGFSGQAFIETTEAKASLVKRLRDAHAKNFKIIVDGGVNVSNASRLIKAGANVLVVGNGVFKRTDYREAIKNLRG